MATLRKNILEEFEEASAKAGAIEGEVTDRLDEIIRFIVDFEATELDTWYFNGAEEGGMGKMEIYDDSIQNVEVFLKHGEHLHKYFTYIIDDYEWSLSGCTIPVKWLFEDFEKEIKSGREKYLKKQEEKKQKRLQRKKQKELKENKLKKSIKSKLSAEELKLLKI